MNRKSDTRLYDLYYNYLLKIKKQFNSNCYLYILILLLPLFSACRQKQQSPEIPAIEPAFREVEQEISNDTIDIVAEEEKENKKERPITKHTPPPVIEEKPEELQEVVIIPHVIVEEELPIEDNNLHPAGDKQPEFPGGETALMKYLTENIIHPESCAGIEGRVVIEFTIDRSGYVQNPTVVRSLHPLLDKSALEAVSNMPQWSPAWEFNWKTREYKRVPVAYVLPITFKTQ